MEQTLQSPALGECEPDTADAPPRPEPGHRSRWHRALSWPSDWRRPHAGAGEAAGPRPRQLRGRPPPRACPPPTGPPRASCSRPAGGATDADIAAVKASGAVRWLDAKMALPRGERAWERAQRPRLRQLPRPAAGDDARPRDGRLAEHARQSEGSPGDRTRAGRDLRARGDAAVHDRAGTTGTTAGA